MYDRKELSKIVKVSDPENWYGQDTITIKLFVCPEIRGKIDVRLFAESIDDFAMEYTRTCFNDEQVGHTYSIMKQFMFDTLPKIVNCKWLLEHGYFPY